MPHVDGRSEAERLPARDHHTGVVFTGDVRIDNRGDLLRELDLRRERLDSEIVMAAYERWGENCAARIIGDFAFALWDPRRRRLFCARDVFGIRPFYYSFQPGRFFAFGTEMRPLFTLPEISRDVNEPKLADWFDVLMEDHGETLYRDVLRLPAAHSLTVGPAGLRVSRYWELDRHGELRLGSDEEYLEAYRDHLTAAVRSRIPDHGPVGSMLNGGLDSSSIACIAADALSSRGEGPLHTFSTIFSDVMESDERPYIDAVLAKGGFDPHFREGGRQTPLGDLYELLERHEHPFCAANTFLVAGLAEAAQGHGVKVLLDGFAGDSTISHGMHYLHELAHGFHLARLAREVRGFGPQLGRPAWKAYGQLVWSKGVKSRAPNWCRELSRLARAADLGSSAETILRSEFAARVNADRAPSAEAIFGPIATSRDQHFYELATGTIPDATEIVDKVGATYDLEIRFPFLDRRLADFCLSLPPDQKLRSGWTRYIHRQALGGVLPEMVRWRHDKGNLGHNFAHVLLSFGAQQLHEAIVCHPEPLEPYVDTEALRAALVRLQTGLATNADTHWLWMAVVARSWLDPAHASLTLSHI